MLRLKARFLCVKYGLVILHLLSTRLLESAWSHHVLSAHLILRLRSNRQVCGAISLVIARTRYAELQTLAIENLVVVEPWCSSIKANIFPRKNLVVSGTAFTLPLCAGISKVILHHISYGKILGRLVKLIAAFNWLKRLFNRPIGGPWVDRFEAICRRAENRTHFGTLLLSSSQGPSGCLRTALDCKI